MGKISKQTLHVKSESWLSHFMKINLVTNRTFETADDARLCADFINPQIHAYIDYASAKYKNNSDAVSWALTWGFADLLHQFHGDLAMLERTMAMYAEMPEDFRTAAQDCKERVQGILTATRLKGFSTTALAWAMLGALSDIHRQMANAQLSPKRAGREADEVTKGLITALNNARRATVN